MKTTEQELVVAFEVKVFNRDNKFQIEVVFCNGEHTVFPHQYNSLEEAAEKANRILASIHEGVELEGIDMSECIMTTLIDKRQSVH